MKYLEFEAKVKCLVPYPDYAKFSHLLPAVAELKRPEFIQALGQGYSLQDAYASTNAKESRTALRTDDPRY